MCVSVSVCLYFIRYMANSQSLSHDACGLRIDDYNFDESISFCDALGTHFILESDLCMNMMVFDNVVKCVSEKMKKKKTNSNIRADKRKKPKRGERER